MKCNRCGNSDQDDFIVIDKEGSRQWFCNLCDNLVKVIELGMLIDAKYQRTLGEHRS